MNKLLLPFTATAALLCACAAPPVPPTPVATAAPPIATSAAPPTSVAEPLNASTKVSLATTPKAYRIDGARHLYATYPDRIFKGKLPPLMHAVVVTETELDAAGNVRSVQMVRVPSHAPEVVVKVRQMIMAASPLPAPQRLGGMRYTDFWLVDKSGRFQLDTLTEGQL